MSTNNYDHLDLKAAKWVQAFLSPAEGGFHYIPSWSKALTSQPYLLSHKEQGKNWRQIQDLFTLASQVLETV